MATTKKPRVVVGVKKPVVLSRIMKRHLENEDMEDKTTKKQETAKKKRRFQQGEQTIMKLKESSSLGSNVKVTAKTKKKLPYGVTNKKKNLKKEKNVDTVPDKNVHLELEQIEKKKLTSVKTKKWTNKQRVLVFSSRGVSYRDRHLMNDIRTLLPHSKPDSKMNKRDSIMAINEICEMKNCNKCVYFEARKKKDLYLWVSNVSRGPSVKFLVENVHTMMELRLTGNCLKGSRAIVTFDKIFDSQPHWKLIKELFVQIFGTPMYHPKSQPFIDHAITFSVVDNRVWMRNYQIVEEDGALAEIGPRFALNPIRIFKGSFGGPTLYENPHYVSPNLRRRELRLAKSGAYLSRVQSAKAREMRKVELEQASSSRMEKEEVQDDYIYHNI